MQPLRALSHHVAEEGVIFRHLTKCLGKTAASSNITGIKSIRPSINSSYVPLLSESSAFQLSIPCSDFTVGRAASPLPGVISK